MKNVINSARHLFSPPILRDFSARRKSADRKKSFRALACSYLGKVCIESFWRPSEEKFKSQVLTWESYPCFVLFFCLFVVVVVVFWRKSGKRFKTCVHELQWEMDNNIVGCLWVELFFLYLQTQVENVWNSPCILSFYVVIIW